MAVKLVFVATILTNSISFPVDAGVYDTALQATMGHSLPNTDQIFLNLYVHQNTKPKSDNYTNLKSNWFGHAYLEITNCYSEPVFLQGFKIKSNHSIIVGLWGTISGSGDSMPSSEHGIFVNREAFYYSQLEDTENSMMIMGTSTKEKLIDSYAFIKEKAFVYDAINYNCTHFATDLWYKLTDQDLRSGTPSDLRARLKEEKGIQYFEGVSVKFETDCFYSYYKNSVRFKKYTL